MTAGAKAAGPCRARAGTVLAPAACARWPMPSGARRRPAPWHGAPVRGTSDQWSAAAAGGAAAAPPMHSARRSGRPIAPVGDAAAPVVAAARLVPLAGPEAAA